MNVNKERFFNIVRSMSSAKALFQLQVDGFNNLLDNMPSWAPPFQKAKSAYVLATTWHETAFTMQPIAEYGKGVGREYGRQDPETHLVYYGRGYVQLTWKRNYERASRELGIDLVHNPELALDPKWASLILFKGMSEGWFTDKGLSTYINISKVDFYNARRVINGTDKAGTIASYAETFREALDE